MGKGKYFFQRIWESLGHLSLVAWLVDIGRNAAFVVSTITAAVVAYWTWSTEHGYLPVFFAALATFVAVVWAINGIVWLRGQARPSRARILFDYSYGLSLEAVPTALDLNNSDNTFEVRLYLRNLASGPMKLLVEKFHTTIGDRFYTIPKPQTFLLCRSAALTLFPGGGFRK